MQCKRYIYIFFLVLLLKRLHLSQTSVNFAKCTFFYRGISGNLPLKSGSYFVRARFIDRGLPTVPTRDEIRHLESPRMVAYRYNLINGMASSRRGVNSNPRVHWARYYSLPFWPSGQLSTWSAFSSCLHGCIYRSPAARMSRESNNEINMSAVRWVI